MSISMRNASLLAILAFVLGACAHGPRGPDHVYSVTEVDSPPVLIGCGQGGGFNTSTVEVVFTVNAQGVPENIGVGIVGPLATDAINSALDLARTCVYEPATLNGRKVAVRGVTRRLTVER